MMVDEVIGNVKSARKNIDSDFQIWYKEILDLAGKLGIIEATVFPERQAYRGIAQTLPVLVQLIITKNLWLFPFLTPWLFKCKTDFLTRTATPITCFTYIVAPSIMVNNTLELYEATESMLFWENDPKFPKSRAQNNFWMMAGRVDRPNQF